MTLIPECGIWKTLKKKLKVLLSRSVNNTKGHSATHHDNRRDNNTRCEGDRNSPHGDVTVYLNETGFCSHIEDSSSVAEK